MSTPIISQPTEQQALFSLMLQYITEFVSLEFPQQGKMTDVARERGIKFGLRYAAISALLGLPREPFYLLAAQESAASDEIALPCLVDWTAPRRRAFFAGVTEAMNGSLEHAYTPVSNLSFIQRFAETHLLAPNLQQALIARVRIVLEDMRVHPAPHVHFLVCAETCSGFTVLPAIEPTDNVINLCHRILEALGAPLPVEPVIVDDLELVGFDAEDEQPQPAALNDAICRLQSANNAKRQLLIIAQMLIESERSRESQIYLGNQIIKYCGWITEPAGGAK